MAKLKIPGLGNPGGGGMGGISTGAQAAPGAAAGAAPMGQAGAPKAGPMAKPGGGGTGFINLQDVLDANKSGAQGMADKVNSDTNNMYTGLMDDASNQINAYTAQPAQWSKEYSALPGTFGQTEGFQGLTDQANKIAQRSAALQSRGGVNAILQDNYGKQQYNQGMNSLDSLLLGGKLRGTNDGQGIYDRLNMWGSYQKPGLPTAPEAPNLSPDEAPARDPDAVPGKAKNDPDGNGYFGNFRGY